MAAPTHTAVGTWGGGRFMRFGEAVDDERLAALLHPDGIATVITADAYGAGEADSLLGRALAGVPRDGYSLVGAVGHDFYAGERRGAGGYPRFTDPSLRDPDGYRDYLRMAVERSLERCGVDGFDLLLLHNPDRRGFELPEVWEALRELSDEGLAAQLGLAPGPANGFTLDVIACLERYGELIDWAMLILSPMEPWPGELALPACSRHRVRVITRVVDYGGLFWDDVLAGHPFPEGDHRGFRPEGWVEAGRAKLDRMRPLAEAHGLTPLQLACQWNLAHEAVACVAPTLIQEPGPEATPIERKREELAAVPEDVVLSEEEVDRLREIGDNRGSMLLKGATPDHAGEERPDRWELSAEHAELARRYGISPERDLRRAGAPAAA
ncbi:MAG TPA: aldo/keto reductase [Thermoleophilaceae bacterium]|nr:aldo/keto reductase [Thermoleophilaceae bacterium]